VRGHTTAQQSIVTGETQFQQVPKHSWHVCGTYRCRSKTDRMRAIDTTKTDSTTDTADMVHECECVCWSALR